MKGSEDFLGQTMLLREGIAALGLAEDEGKLSLLGKYLHELSLWNRTAGLVNAEGEELVVKHLLDSLSAVRILESVSPKAVADAGSGAGLPGIPLSIYCAEPSFDLIERSGKRAGFLRNAIGLLGLRERVSVKETEVEAVTGPYDAVVFRAFRSLKEYYPVLVKMAGPGGILLAYKGRRALVEEEVEMLTRDHGQIRKVEIIPIQVPFLNEERHLLVIYP